jgi:hypothetical protein
MQRPERMAYLSACAGALLQVSSAWSLARGSGSTGLFWILFIPGILLWSGAFVRAKGLERAIPLALPFVLPVAGPFLLLMGFLIHAVYGRKGYLLNQVEFSEYDTHLVLPGEESDLRSVLSRVRMLQPAGDILNGSDTALKQSVITLIGRIRSPDVVRLLQGAKNDPDDEIRLTTATVLTRLEKDYLEEITRLSETVSENRNTVLGNGYFAYADSGLVEADLQKIALKDGLGHFRNAVLANEPMEPDLLQRIGFEAIRQGDTALFDRIRTILGDRGEGNRVSVLDLASCYERRDFSSFVEKIAGSSHGIGRVWSEMLASWKGKRPGEIL